MNKLSRRISTLLLAVSVCGSIAIPTYAENYFDAKLTRIESLMAQAKAKGINTDYEQVAYSTVKRTQSKLLNDEANGKDTQVVAYNKAKMDNMLDEAISNLEGYINGTKKAKKVSLPSMGNVNVSGSSLKSGGKSVFSVGYGHQDGSLEPDVQDMNKYGSTNIHLEAGPMRIKSFENPFDFEQNNTNTVIEYDASVSHSGTYSLKVTNNTEKSVSYARLTKNIPCEPNTEYILSVWTKYESQNTDGLYLMMRRDWTEPTVAICAGDVGTVSRDWANNTVTVTTDAEQTSFELSFIIEGKCTLWIDDMSVKKVGTDTELFYNGSLDKYEMFDNTGSEVNTSVKSAVAKAKANNVGVEFLLSPHYFPGTKNYQDCLKIAGVEYDTVDRESSEGVFLSYNVANENAKRVIADYIKALFDWFEKNNMTSAINSIILSNEPIFRTTWYSDYYTPLFREFLKEKYGTVDAMKSELGSKHSSFDSISMPDYNTASEDKTGLDYDWVEFNDKVFVSWHEFIAQEVKKYTDKPVSVKAGYAFETSGEGSADRITKGYDFEKLSKFTDITGFDQVEYREYPIQYWTNMMFYDYMDSVVGKPMYNSEVHFSHDGINDNDGSFSYTEATAAHSGNYLWMSAAHGVDMFSNWCWDEGGHVPYTLLSRPDVIGEVGTTALDMARLSENLTALSDKKPQIAIFYSKASRLYEMKHMEFMVDAYRTLAAMGVKVGFVTEDSLELLDNYNALILPAVKYTTDAAKAKVSEFVQGGGKVLSLNKKSGFISTTTDKPMSADEHKNSTSELSNVTASANVSTGSLSGYEAYNEDGPNSTIKDAVKNFAESNITREITVTDASGNEVSGIDWSYAIDGQSLMINVSNVTSSTAKSLKFYQNGVQITDMKNLITGETGISTVTASLYEPVMLYVGPTNQVSIDVSELEIADGYLIGNVKVTNDSLYDEEAVVISVEAYNNSDKIRGYQRVTTVIPNGATDGFKAMMPIESDVTHVKVSVTNEERTELLALSKTLYPAE